MTEDDGWVVLWLKSNSESMSNGSDLRVEDRLAIVAINNDVDANVVESGGGLDASRRRSQNGCCAGNSVACNPSAAGDARADAATRSGFPKIDGERTRRDLCRDCTRFE